MKPENNTGKGFIKGVFMNSLLKYSIILLGIGAIAALVVILLNACGSQITGDITGPGSPTLPSFSVNTSDARTVYHSL